MSPARALPRSGSPPAPGAGTGWRRWRLTTRYSACSPRRGPAPASAGTSTRPPRRAARARAAATPELSGDPRLYAALREVDGAGFDPASQHLLAKALRDFRRAGVD